MNSKSQEQFLRWAESKDERWPEVKKARFKVALLDVAIQEGVAHYLKKEDITPLRQFLEFAAKSVSRNSSEKILSQSLAHKGMPANQENRARVLAQLCDLYGFVAEYESGWRTCVESGFDCDTVNYLVFGIHCQERRFGARQAYYFHSLRPPLTDPGRKQKGEIFPLVEEELKAFESQERKNLFDFYLDIGQAVYAQCSVVPDLDKFKEPNGQDLFERGQFQERIIGEFQRQFTAGLSPFEERLKAAFDDPDEFAKAREQAFARFKIDLSYPIRQKREFLYRHFYEVGSRAGLGGASAVVRRVFKDGHHQVMLPFFPLLIRQCMARHIAKLFRDCEDRFRQGLGLRGVGQGWVSEATLFAQLKKAFPQEIVLHHAKPEWIGRQHLDIYFPRLNVAVEYQGVQHGQSVAIFGGEAALRVRQQLDKRKKELCKANTCLLIEAFPEDAIDSIIARIRNQTKPGEVAPPTTPQIPKAFAIPSAQARNPNDDSTASPAETPSKRRKSESWKKHLGKDDLAACARHGDGDLIHRLAEERAGLKGFRNGEKETLLFIACKEGNTDTAAALLEVGLSPNARDWRKASILSKICNRWRVRPKPEIIRLLLERGANPKLHGTLTPAIFDRCGYALPMNGCCIDGFLDCAQVLFEWTKTVNQQQTYSLLTPIMCACHRFDRHQHSHRSLEVIQWLIENGADLEMRSRIGCTPMDFALGASWYQPVIGSNTRADHVAPKEILQLLQKTGARPSEPFKHVLELALSKLCRKVLAN